MLKLLHLVAVLLLASSCTKSPNRNVHYLLTGNAEKHWVRVMRYPIKKYRGVVFRSNKTFTEYTIREDGRRLIHFTQPGYGYKIIDDTVMEYSDAGAFKIEYLSEEVLVLNHKKHGVDVYLKAKDQSTKDRYPTAKEDSIDNSNAYKYL